MALNSRRRGCINSAKTNRRRPGGNGSTRVSLSSSQQFGKYHRGEETCRGEIHEWGVDEAALEAVSIHEETDDTVGGFETPTDAVASVRMSGESRSASR